MSGATTRANGAAGLGQAARASRGFDDPFSEPLAKLRRWALRWQALTGAYARVRQRNLDGPDGQLGGDDVVLERAREMMPRGYDVDAIYEYPRVDARAALTWMEAQAARAGRFRYLPLLGRDCFTFAKDALQRAGAPVLLWQLYLQRGDGAVPRLRVVRPK